ncbi:MAG: putative lipid II flippase FtsW [Alphaproteobacteria bacterium]|nr:putative lipid II flippase FtsW [Alphaproteobacteria bacterium]MBO6627358.1 putative lipid II flippase FtsW [Alphaproteobacteria bacterium]MDF1626930.1 putative lipid II flippase FtsW [Parvibaculaceae bacterium]
MIRVSRANRSSLSEWWWTIDRLTVLAILMLILLGIVMSLAASPAVANRLSLDGFHFVYRQAVFLVPAIAVMFGVSLLTTRQIRRLAALVFGGGMVLMLGTLIVGPEIKGATRWLQFGRLSIQPSEFVKPAFIVLAAWMFAEGARQKSLPGKSLAFLLYGIFVGLLLLQPDFGQATLVTLVFGGLLFMVGISWFWIIGLGALGIGGAVAAYQLMPHVASRVDRFMDPASGDTYQIDRAMEAVRAGGFFGQGLGEGVVKRILPDAHTDFIFAVAAEEFGVLAGILIIGLFSFIVIRSLMRAMEETDLFVQLAVSGLTLLIGAQALINLSVNLNLMPAKGMTLPFISYGGSSLLALALATGMLLGLNRRRVHASARPSEWRAFA